MHLRLPLLLVTACLTAAALPTQEPGARPDRPRRERREQAPVELKNLTFREEKFASESVGHDVTFGIYLPKDYDEAANKDTKWPLVIWLHGMWEDHLRFHTRGGAPVLDAAIGGGKLPPCIFVTANAGRTSMYLNRKDERWEDMVTKDLLAHLAKTYRVTPTRELRAITGVSMGGMAALRIAFSRPELFGAVGAHSSAVFDDDPEKLPERVKGMVKQLGLDEVVGNPIKKEVWQQFNPLCLANSVDAKKLATVQIYFDAGTGDRYGFAAGNTLLHEALEKRGIRHTWRLIEGGGHSWGAGFQDQTLPYSFAMIGEMFAAAAKAADTDGKGKAAESTGKPARGGDK